MAHKTTLSDLRNALEAIMIEIAKAAAGGDVDDRAAIKRLKKERAADIEKLTPELLDIALVKLGNDVGSRKGVQAVAQVGIDLFGTYPGVPNLISMGRGKKKYTRKASFRECDLWISSHDAQPIADGTVKNPGFRSMVEELRPWSTGPDDTIEQAIERKARAEGRKTA